VGTFEMREATADDLISLAPRLRQADIEEILINKDSDVTRILLQGLATSAQSWVLLWDGVVEFAGGVVDAGNGVGIPWQVGSDAIRKHVKKYLEVSKQVLQEWQTTFTMLHNFVGVHNTESIHYIKRLGFTIGDQPVPIGDNEVAMVYFFWRRDDDVRS